MSGAGADSLTIERLFAAPALSGPAILSPQFSPDGRRVIYLRGNPLDNNRLDLWEYDLSTRRPRRLVDTADLPTADAALSAEEAARRERQRTAGLRGILDYQYDPSGKSVIFHAGGPLFRYVFDEESSGAGAATRLTRADTAATDVRISPAGRMLAFVRDQNLVVFDLDNLREQALTVDGGGPISNGMAEFIAQEEMDRSTGYWWSPDGARIAFTRVDESNVPLRRRFDIGAAGMTVIEQRYPAAGETNARVQLGVVDIGGGPVRWMDLGADEDVYIARVDWLPDGRTVAVQRQTRDQRRLDLLFADTATGATRLILSETSGCWIDLHDELTFLRGTPEFIWASSRDGHRHLYLHDLNGRLIRRLTEGPWIVEDFRARAIKCVDEKKRMLYFTATREHPAERHLYAVSIDAPVPQDPRRITAEPGIHAVTMSADGSCYVDRYSSPAQPPQAAIHWLDGRAPVFLCENSLNEGHPYFAFLADESAPSFGTLTARDGSVLHYRLFAPAARAAAAGASATGSAAQRRPAIIDVYGGPGAQRVVKNWSGGSFTQVMTRAGYYVLQLDNRGSAGRGETFKAAIHGQLGVAEVEDQVQAAKWLAQHPGVDPDRIGVWGWSYGGYMTLMLMCKAPDLFRAGVAGAPVTDWTLYDTHYTERFLGKPVDNGHAYQQSSVLAHLGPLRGSLMVMHGMADDNVLFTHSTLLFEALQRMHKPFEIMAYPGGKHGLTRTADGCHAYMTIRRFFDRNL